MGRQTNIKLTGTFENVIYYKSRGGFYIRSKPPAVKRVPIAIKNSGIFGKAASSSRFLRALLKPILPLSGRRTIMYRVNAVFKDWLRTDPLRNTDPVDAIPFFNGLSLHPENEWHQFFKVSAMVIRSNSGQLQLQLPAFDPAQQIKAPVGTTKFQIQIAVAAMQINDSSGQDFFRADWLVDYKPGMVGAQDFDLPINTAAGRLLVAAISLLYFNEKNTVVNQPAWKSAGIVGSFFN